MMLASDLTTYYNRVRRHLDCPKDEQNRLLLGVNKQVIELQADNPNLDYDGIVEFLGEPESLATRSWMILIQKSFCLTKKGSTVFISLV